MSLFEHIRNCYLRFRRRNARIYVLGGGPGAGKDTQAGKIGFPVISTGALCRAEIESGSALGKEIKSYVDSGKLAPDTLVFQLLEREIGKPKYYDGFVLNGFPRRVEQAKMLDELLSSAAWRRPITCAIMLEVPEEDLVERLSLRRTCKKCGASYHLKFKPPAKPNVCNTPCGGELYQRADDNPEAIKERLRLYRETAASLYDYFRAKRILKIVNSTNAQTPDQVSQLVLAALNP